MIITPSEMYLTTGECTPTKTGAKKNEYSIRYGDKRS